MSIRPVKRLYVKQRIHSFDALRIAIAILVVVAHASQTFMTFDWWPSQVIPSYLPNNTHHVFDYIVVLIHPLGTTIFSLLAGFFANLIYSRNGPRKFFHNRVKRVLIPFILALFLLTPLLALIFVHANFGYEISLNVFISLFLSFVFFKADTSMHLWFLYYLLYFYLIILLVGPLFKRASKSISESIDDTFRYMIKSPFKPVVFALITTILLLPFNFDIWLVRLSFIPNIPQLIYFGVFFIFGWLLYRQPELLEEFKKHALWYIVASILILPITFIAFNSLIAHNNTDIILKTAYSYSFFLLKWLMVFGIIGIFVKYLNKPMKRVQNMANASYWLYLTHLPLLIYLRILVSDIQINIFLKFFFIVFTTVGVLLIIYHYFVRYTIIGKILNDPIHRK